MAFASRLTMWLRALLRRRDVEHDMQREIAAHVAMEQEHLQRTGLSASEAHRQAMIAFGGMERHKEAVRDEHGTRLLGDLSMDLRYAVRRLRQRPGFTIAVVAILALGIGATTAIFSAVDAALLRPLPFPRPQELMTLRRVVVPIAPRPGQVRRTFANHQLDFSDVAAMPATFSHVAAWAAGGINLSDPDHPKRLNVGVVTAGFFNTLGVNAAIGRGFAPEEGKPGNGHVAILSFELWQQQFGGRDMVQQTILLNGKPYLIIGVMPRTFSFPRQSDLWIPMSIPATAETFEPFRGYLPSEVIARTVTGLNADAAGNQLLAKWALGIARDSAGASETNLPKVVADLRRTGAMIPLQQYLIGDRRQALYVLLAATALLLLVACANVTNLLLSQSIDRRREIAVRAALGATRTRVVRQLLTESILLAMSGALLGLVLAPASLGLLRTLLPPDLAGVAPAQVDLRVLAFTTFLGVATGIAFGLWPALRTAGLNLATTIKSGGGHGSSGANRVRRMLVATELALTVILLIGATLMLRSFQELMRLDGGLKNEQVGTLEISFPADSNAPFARLRLVGPLLDRLVATAGIAAAGVVNNLPIGHGGGLLLSVTADGMPESHDPNRPGPLELFASSDYFSAMNIPFIAGRTFTAADEAQAGAGAVINQRMAELYWPGVNALGRTFHDDDRVITVVGIVRDIREGTLEQEAMPQMYRPIFPAVPSTIALVVRGSLAPRALLAAMQGAVHAVDPSQAIYHLRTMDEVVSNSVAPRRTNTLLIALFAGLALILASLGVYAVVAHGVAQRSREFAIRTALGATGSNLVSLISRELIWTAVGGIAAGLGAAWTLTRVAEKMFFGVTSHDPVTFLVVPAMLLVPATLATILPARRALRIRPADVMRAD